MKFIIEILFLVITVPYICLCQQSSNVFRFEPISLVEEPPIGTLIFDLASKLDINDLATSDYKFRFYSPHSITSHYFLIDQLTGHVKTQRSIDREYLCETKACGPCNSNSNCSLPIEIVAASSYSNSQNNKQQQQKFVSFDVIIEDKNEFAPQFPNKVLVLNISEGAPINFTIPLDPATDRDSKQTQIIYRLEPILNDKKSDDYDDYSSEMSESAINSSIIESSEVYQSELKKLNSRIRLSYTQNQQQMQNQMMNGMGAPSGLSLVISEPFDYEQEKELRFRLLASDGGGSSQSSGTKQTVLTGSCLVILKIIDINDNLPVFDRLEYEYSIDEDKATSGTPLIRVHATDKDDGLNGLVKYSLVDQSIPVFMSQSGSSGQLNLQQTSQQVTNLFKIDELTGWISVSNKVKCLDYEQASVYRINVRAQDSGLANSMPVYTNVIIYLNDVNDNAPTINLTVPSSIDDVNNNLSIENNQMNLSEWTMPDTFIAQIIINDLDSAENGRVKLQMNQFKRATRTREEKDEDDLVEKYESSTDFDLVHLFNNIYSIVTKKALDRETYDKYLINITAVDNGLKPLKTNLKMIINIKDENDNKPEFLSVENATRYKNGQLYYEFNVPEQSSFSDDDWYSIGTVKAIDYDLDSVITYQLDLIGPSSLLNLSSWFKIDKLSGLILAKSSVLDREISDSYYFRVSAIDNANSYTNTDLIINLIDMNDNKPTFEKDLYEFRLNENRIETSYIGKVKAYDLDRPNSSYSVIRYKIVNGRNDFIRLDESNGELYQIKEIDYEQIEYIEMEIMAYDDFISKVNSLNSTCLVRIYINDLNDNAPIIITPQYSQLPLVYWIEKLVKLNNSNNISYNTQIVDYSNVSMHLLTLNATDLDSFGENSNLNFKIDKQMKLKQKNDAGEQDMPELVNIFQIDKASGAIGLNLNLIKRRTIQYENNLVKRSASRSGKGGNLIGSFKLNHNSSKHGHHHHTEEASEPSLLIDFDHNVLGVYGLVINISDSSRVNPLTTRIFLFIGLNSNFTADGSKISDQLRLLKRILNETSLDDNDDELDYYQMDDSSDSEYQYDDSVNRKESKFSRIVSLFKYSLTNLDKQSLKRRKSNSKLLSSNVSGSKSSKFNRIKSEIMNAFSGKNYKYFLVFSISSVIMISFIIVSLCMSVYYYKQRIKKQSYPYGNNYDSRGGKKPSSSSSSSSSSLTKTTLNHTSINATTTTCVTSLIANTQTSSSASPSSLASSELIHNMQTPNYITRAVTNSTGVESNIESCDDSAGKNGCSFNEESSLILKSSNGQSSFIKTTCQSSLLRMGKYSKRSKEILISNGQMNVHKGIHCDKVDLNTSGEEERAILIVNTNSPTTTSNSAQSASSSSSNNALSNHTELTSNNTSLNITNPSNTTPIMRTSVGKSNKNTQQNSGTNPLLVLVSNDRKIVASTESLSSINTLSNNSKIKTSTLNADAVLIPPAPPSTTSISASSSSRSSALSTTSHKQQQSGNFKTFKSAISPNQPNHQQQQQQHVYLDNSRMQKSQNYSNNYKTMPINGYRNLVNEINTNNPNNTNSNNTTTNSTKPTVKTNNVNFDQKQLNLPVNELFKRYELKRQAAGGIGLSSGCGSSGSLSSLNSLHSNQQLQQQKNQKLSEVSTFTSPKLAHRNLKLNAPVNTNTQTFTQVTQNSTTTTTQIPDYFFKDEKEYKKFLLNSNKQKLNCKHVVVLSRDENNQLDSSIGDNTVVNDC